MEIKMNDRIGITSCAMVLLLNEFGNELIEKIEQGNITDTRDIMAFARDKTSNTSTRIARRQTMANPTQQLTVADLEAAKMKLDGFAHGAVGSCNPQTFDIAATCIGIVEEILKCHKKGHVRVCDLRDTWLKAVAAFGGEVK